MVPSGGRHACGAGEISGMYMAAKVKPMLCMCQPAVPPPVRVLDAVAAYAEVHRAARLPLVPPGRLRQPLHREAVTQEEQLDAALSRTLDERIVESHPPPISLARGAGARRVCAL
eukprot:scaffold120703_cov75-Phaeocystis_antarctica.AAC.2